MNKVRYNLLPIVLIAAMIVYFTISSIAYPTGITGYTASPGCYCHSTSPSSSTTVTLQSGSLSVEPGSQNSYTVRVANSSQVKAGTNIAVKTSSTGTTNAGSLEPASGSGLKKESSELTHSQPKNLSDGYTDFSFTWTAPTTPGTYYLRAAGNAVNNANGSNGDLWNYMTVQEISVKGIQLTEPVASNLSFCVNNSVTIKWNQTGVSNVKIDLSTNGGSSWDVTIVESTSAASGSYSWNIPSNFQTGSQFRIRVSDASSASLSSAMENNFSIMGTFSIAAHPESKTACSGSNVSFKVSLNGSGNIQWMKNGTPLSGATDSTLTLTNINAGSAGSYSAAITSNCGTPANTNPAVLTVTPPTTITTQPLNVNACAGSPAVFSVTAQGENLSYQWYLDNDAISGATTSQYTISNVNNTHTGDYYVNVTSDCGVLKSSVVKLMINSQPEITTQPQAKTVCENETVTFTVAASGLENIYEWYRNEVKLNVPTNNSLIIENVSEDNQGEYHVIVRNNCGEPVRSSTVSLIMNSKPEITSNPQNKTITVGGSAEFNVTASNGTLSYQWRKNETNITGATTSKYTIEAASKADAGAYDCIVTNSCGNVTSSKATLNVEDPVEGPGFSLLTNNLLLDGTFRGSSADTTLSNFITNSGSATLVISSITIIGADAADFEISPTTMEIESGQSENLMISFNPQTAGTKTATVVFTTNTDTETYEMTLTANSVNFNITPSVPNIDFENVELGNDNELSFFIQNPNPFAITLTSAEFMCDSQNKFTIMAPEFPASISPMDSIEVVINFDATEEGTYECTMNLGFEGIQDVISMNVKGVVNPTSVEENNYISYFISYPNPASSKLVFEFQIQDLNNYTLEIVSPDGRLIRSFEKISQNTNAIEWDGKDNAGINVSNGTYIGILKSGSSVKTQNIIIVK